MIVKAWKSPHLQIGEVKARMHSNLMKEKMSAILEDRISRIEKIWPPWICKFLLNGFKDNLLQLVQPN